MTITLRPQTQDDTPFVRALFDSWKAGDLGFARLEPAMLQTLLDMQWHAHRTGSAAALPHASRQVVEVAGEAAGLLVLDHTPECIRLCEIALMPRWRHQGLGARLVAQVQQEARARDAAIRLHVSRHNSARRFYERLGFVAEDDNGVQLPMAWHPARSPA